MKYPTGTKHLALSEVRAYARARAAEKPAAIAYCPAYFKLPPRARGGAADGRLEQQSAAVQSIFAFGLPRLIFYEKVLAKSPSAQKDFCAGSKVFAPLFSKIGNSGPLTGWPARRRRTDPSPLWWGRWPRTSGWPWRRPARRGCALPSSSAGRIFPGPARG